MFYTDSLERTHGSVAKRGCSCTSSRATGPHSLKRRAVRYSHEERSDPALQRQADHFTALQQHPAHSVLDLDDRHEGDQPQVLSIG